MPGSTNWNRYPDFQSVQYGFESHTRYKMWMWCNGSHTWFRVKRPKGHMGSSPVIHTHIGRSSNRVRIPLWYSGNPGSSPGFPTKESSLTYCTHLGLSYRWLLYSGLKIRRQWFDSTRSHQDLGKGSCIERVSWHVKVWSTWSEIEISKVELNERSSVLVKWW